MNTANITKKPISSLSCLLALANIVPDKCKITLHPDSRDATIIVAYVVADGSEAGRIETSEVTLSLLNDAYVGVVKLWPMIKETKDAVLAQLSSETKAARVAAIKAKKDEASAGVAKRKADRKAASEAKAKEKADKRAAALALKEAQKAAKAAEKAKEAAAKAELAKAKLEQKALAEKLKKDSDAIKLKEAAKAQAAKKADDAGAKAVAAVKGSMGSKSPIVKPSAKAAAK